MRQHQQHPTQLEIAIIGAILLAALVIGEALIYTAQQVIARCGSLCGAMFSESFVRMFSR